MLFNRNMGFSKKRELYSLIVRYALIILLSYIVSKVLAATLWKTHTTILHTFTETICVFIALASFFIVFLSSNIKNISTNIISYGILSVAIFDIFHTFFYQGLNLHPEGYYDLSARYWLAGRLTEAVVILFSILLKKGFVFENKWICIIITISYSLSVSLIILFFQGLLPVLYTESGVTAPKIIIECVIITLLIICLINIKKKLNSSEIIAYRHVLMAILIAIPAELCFSLFTTVSCFLNAFGHILKIVYYAYLFNGIFVSAVIYPYKKLNEEHIKLEEAYNSLEETRRREITLSDQTNTILNVISNIVVLTDKNNKIILCNNAFAQVVEMNRNELIGQDLYTLCRNLKFCCNGNEIMFENIKGNYNLSDVTCIKPSGKKICLLLQTAQVLSSNNEVEGYVVVFTDITPIKEEQKKIIRQEKLAIIGEMGSGIVHETKNHLASIRGYCQLLSSNAKDERLNRYISRIETISDDINKVIVEFLALAKPSETVMDIISLNETIEAMRYMLESPSFIKGVRIIIDLVEEDREIKGDEAQIKQIILNMAKNAIEAMTETENPQLIISTRLDADQKEMQLIISDNGKGISEQNLNKIGMIFFTTKESGTGIGLSVCYRIVQKHEGRIEVSSKENKGTKFTICFPCYE